MWPKIPSQNVLISKEDWSEQIISATEVTEPSLITDEKFINKWHWNQIKIRMS